MFCLITNPVYLSRLYINIYMARHNELGKWGEDLACEKLVAEGCAIVERNWRMGHFEVDIVAMKGNRIIFAEVKTRANATSDPLDAIDKRKIMRMSVSADAYIRHSNCKHEPQFDVFAISGTPNEYTLEHIPDAFFPPLKTYK